MENTLKILEVFGRYTGLRHCTISEKSGEEFYHQYLNGSFYESFSNKTLLTVDLDGVRGYSPSFLDEAFGNLVYDFELSNVEKFLKIKSEDFPFWAKNIKEETFPSWEKRRINKEKPVKTEDHQPWWRLIDSVPEKVTRLN